LCRPHRAQLHFAGLGAAVGLFANAPAQGFRTHRHAGAILPQIHRARPCAGRRLAGLAFKARRLRTQTLGVAFDLPRRHRQSGQLAQQAGTFDKTHRRPTTPTMRCTPGDR
jgi:hypothetical protein